MTYGPLLVLLAACVALTAALIRAVTNSRTLQAQLTAAQQAPAPTEPHLDAVKNDFIANVSHELRTPLTSIRGALGLLSSGLLPATDPRAQNLFAIALSNTDRLIRLINDLLDLDRIASGHAPPAFRRCFMPELARQAIETMSPQADARSVRLHLVLAAPTDCLFFDAEPDRILQVLTNLLSNAIKFSPPCSIVEIRVEAHPDTLCVRVCDSGRGIPPEKLASIFGRFEQVEPADAREKGGTGLGLAICRTIMQQHGGAIWAESNPAHNRGPGASLFLTFPRSARQRDAFAAHPTQSTCGTILICDSDSTLRGLVAATILRHGYRVLEASTPEQALTLASHKLDAILLDLAMPGREGLALIDWLRRQPATADLPLVVYSVPQTSPAISPEFSLRTSSASDTQPANFPSTPNVEPHEVEDLVLGIVQRLQASRIEALA